MMEPGLGLGQGLVVRDRDLDGTDVGELREVAACLLDHGGVLGVDVWADARPQRVALHRHAERIALVVEDRHLAPVGLRVPEDVPWHVHRSDVLADLVVAPADPVGPRDVGRREAAAAVVGGVLELRPDVPLEVGKVRMVERLQQLLGDEVDDVRAREADDDVEADGTGRELRDRLVRGVVRRDLDLDSVPLLETLEYDRVEIVGVVVDA